MLLIWSQKMHGWHQLDLKDAFLSVPIHKDHQKYLKFVWGSCIYKSVAMPNGYKDAMRVFTKICKVPFSVLRREGYMSVVYVDDSFLLGDTFTECLANINATIKLLTSLGFTIHVEKSIIHPTQIITFLGFVINSKTMHIS